MPVRQSVTSEIKSTTCYMCACRCGINVTVENGEVSFIQGNPHHPINKGVLCAHVGAAGVAGTHAVEGVQVFVEHQRVGRVGRDSVKRDE